MNTCLVPFQDTFVIGAEFTLIASESLEMNFHVTFQTHFILQRLGANLTLDFLTGMHTLNMCEHLSFLRKGLVTHITLVRFEAKMDGIDVLFHALF